MYSIVIEGKPTAKARPRFTRSGRAYTPKKTAAYENAVKAAWIEKYGMERLEGPVELEAVFYISPPKSLSRKKFEVLVGERGPVIKRPDIDNYIKAIQDGLNETAYMDDSQVYSVMARKVYGIPERAEVYLEAIDYGR